MSYHGRGTPAARRFGFGVDEWVGGVGGTRPPDFLVGLQAYLAECYRCQIILSSIMFAGRGFSLTRNGFHLRSTRHNTKRLNF